MNEKQEELQSIVYYKQWAEMLMKMPPDLRHAVHDALDVYMIEKKMPDESDPIYWVFFGIVQQVTKDKQHYQERIVERNRANGAKGGRPRKNPENPKNPVGLKKPKKPNGTQKTHNVNDNVNVNDNDNIITPIGVGEKRKRFVPPTLEEIKSYIEEKGISVDAEKFFLFYESKGWYVGKNKMKSWHAAVGNWERSEHGQPMPTRQTMTTRQTRTQNDKNINDLWK